MELNSGDTEAAGITPEQCIHILGQCTDLNLLPWIDAIASSISQGHHTPHPREHPGRPLENTYTFSQSVPNLEEAHTLPVGDTRSHHASIGTETPPSPIPWTPRFLPETWVYTHGSDIKGHP